MQSRFVVLRSAVLTVALVASLAAPVHAQTADVPAVPDVPSVNSNEVVSPPPISAETATGTETGTEAESEASTKADPNENVTPATTSPLTAAQEQVSNMSPSLAIGLGALVLLVLVYGAVRFAARHLGNQRAWTLVGVPVAAAGIALLAWVFGQIQPEASGRLGYGYGYGYGNASPTYFLLQTRHSWGAGNSFVQRFDSPEAIAEARVQMALPARTGSAQRKVPTGTLRKMSDRYNPTWSWSWDSASMDFTKTTASQACNQQQQVLELMVATWSSTNYCPENTYVTKEIGTALPVRTVTLNVPNNAWLYAGVPYNDMSLDAAGSDALREGTLYVFTWNPTDGSYTRITDPNYKFHAGEGYMMLGLNKALNVKLTGVESYADTLHLKQGWNLVSFPNTTKRSVASVYSSRYRYQWPALAERNKLVYRLVSTYAYSPSKGYTLQSTSLPALSATTMPGDHALWMFAYTDVVLQFK